MVPGAGRQTVRREALDLLDFCLEFVADDDGAELPVESADRVELLVQQRDSRLVDAAGGGEPGSQDPRCSRVGATAGVLE